MSALSALLASGEAIPLKDFSTVEQRPAEHIVHDREHKWYRSTKWFWCVRILTFLIICISGPIALRLLDNHYFQNKDVYTLNGIQYGLPCDVEPLWSSWASLFEINLRTGTLSFTAAKIIDASFDLVIGRGGQLLLAWQSGLVYKDVLMRFAEASGVDLHLFIALALDPHSLTTFWTAQGVWRWSKSRRGAVLISGLSLTGLYVVAFPTLISTATSLVASTIQGVQLPNGDTMSRQELFDSASYMLNYTGNTTAPTPWIINVSDMQQVPTDYMVDDCYLLMLVNNDDSKGWTPTATSLALQNGTNYTLESTTKIGCGFFLAGVWLPADTQAADSQSKTGTWQGATPLFKKYLVCVPDSNRYQWGASWEMMMLIVVLHVVWSIALILLEAEATRTSRMARKGWSLGSWRAIADTGALLSAAVDEPTLARSSEHEMQEIVAGLPLVSYDCDDSYGSPSVRLRRVSAHQ